MRPWSWAILAIGTDLVADIGLVEDGGEIDALGLPVFGGFVGVEALDVADHFVDRAETAARP